MSIPLSINPKAKGARTHYLRSWVSSLPKETFDVFEPESIEEFRLWLRTLAQQAVPVVAVAGGDGTLSIAASELMGSSTALGIIPSGTMNVLARELGINTQDYHHALDVIQNGCVRNVDAFLMNDSPLIQMGGTGYDAEIVRSVTWNKKKRWGALAYVFEGIRCLFKKFPLITVIDHEGCSHTGYTALFGNGGFYGGSIRLFPQAHHQDGKLDVLLFKKIGWTFLGQFIRAIISPHSLPQSKHVEYFQVSSCQVKTDKHVATEKDGDDFLSGEYKISLSSFPIRVVAPK